MASLPSYVDPPVSEVVIGVQFAPIEELLAPHVGRYWNTVRDVLQRAEEHAPVGHIVEQFREERSPEIRLEALTKPPLPRSWFLDLAGSRLVQLQRDRFLYNWRRTSASGVYPRYPTIKQAFFGFWAGFLAFLQQENLPLPTVDQCELTYVNHIRHDQAWKSMEDLGSVFSCIAWSPRGTFLPTPEGVRWDMRFLLPENQGRLYAEAVPARLVSENVSIIRFSLTARGMPHGAPDDRSLSAWYDLAHEWIVRGFSELVSVETDALWRRER
jgi:uncharacterized protein (TIGR04255 family)